MATNIPNLNQLGEVLKNCPYFKLGETSFGKQVQLEPKTGIVDVYATLPWRAQTGPSPAELEIPYLMLKEYRINLSGLLANLNTLFDTIAGGVESLLDVYKKLYIADPTGFNYKLPWLIGANTPLMGSKNEWGDHPGGPLGFGGPGVNLRPTDSKKAAIFDFAAGAARYGANMIKGIAPGVRGFDEIAFFKNASKKSISISFPLYNTLDNKSAFNNYSFVFLLVFQNTMTRTSLFTYIPPRIYEVQTGGVGGIYMAAANLTNLEIANIGTTRLLNPSEFGYVSQPILIPEAYRVSFTISDMLPPSTQLMTSANGGSPVSVIGPNTLGEDLANTGVVQTGKRIGNAVLDGFKGIFQ